MADTYRAVLKDDRLEWIDHKPNNASDKPLDVQVTILDSGISPKSKSRGAEMAACLQKIADLGGVKDIQDPVAWQREIRKDRPLPGRDE